MRLRNYLSPFLWTVSFLLLLSGCVATTTDVDRLQDSLKVVQKSQADLIVKMDELDLSLGSLSEKLDSSQKKMAALSQKLDDTQSRLGSRMELISKLLSEATTQASVPVPGDVFRTAYGDYVSGKTDLAITEFKSFLERYPTSDLSDDAQFHLADCYLTKKDFIQARVELDKVLATSPEFRSQALLKRSYALAGSGQVADQKLTLQTLIKEFPNSSETQTAKQILQELESKEPPHPKKHKPDLEPELSPPSQ